MMVTIKGDDLPKRFLTQLLLNLYVLWKRQNDRSGEQRKSYSSGCKYLVVGEMFHSKRVTQEFWGG